MDSDDDIFEDDFDIIDIIDFGFPRKIYERQDHFQNLDNLTFFRRFRLMKDTVLHLLILIEDDLELPTDINNSVSPMQQLLTVLRFYASAGHLATIADFGGMDISTVPRIIVKVSTAIARLYPRYIKMPTPEEVIHTQNEFYRVASFPRILGVLDGTHIKIQSPGGEDAEVYRNRKSYFSINVQGLCNAKLQFGDIVARWPGSAHDATIYNNSRIRARFEAGEFPNSVLLGDSGYPVRSYFFTPLLNPVTRGEMLYNESLIRTRNIIERCFGVWKRRFPVLAYGMRLKLETILTVIIATAVLHNIAIDMHEEEPPVPEDINIEELEYLIGMGNIPDVPVGNDNIPADNFRNNLILNYFSNL